MVTLNSRRGSAMKSQSSNKPRILIADDQADVLEALRLLFKGEDYQVEAVNSPGKAFEKVCAEYFELALMDLNYARDTTSAKEGMNLLAQIVNLDSSLKCSAQSFSKA